MPLVMGTTTPCGGLEAVLPTAKQVVALGQATPLRLPDATWGVPGMPLMMVTTGLLCSEPL